MTKVLILGAKGMLGREFLDFFELHKEYQTIPVDKDNFDIKSFSSVKSALNKYKPDFVINCAALINVEYCESHPIEAYSVNSFGPGNIARALADLEFKKTKFIHISTSDVFGGEKKFFKESDNPNPVNVYGWSKFLGEKILEQESKASSSRYFIIRTNSLYS